MSQTTMNNHENIWYIFRVHPHETELSAEYELLGKFWLHDGQVSVLEDHNALGGRKQLENLTPEEFYRTIKSLSMSQRRLVVSSEQLRSGSHPEVLPTLNGKHPPGTMAAALHESIVGDPNPISEFLYHRVGMPAPQELKLQGTQGFLDGQLLAPEELGQVMDNINTGKATLRHKVEEPPQTLIKVEPMLAEALSHASLAVKQGHMHPDSLKTLQRHLFSDTMIPSMGNKVAYKDFLSRPRPGIHIHLDLNDFGGINKQHGFQAGDQAITAAGNAIREAMNESVGKKNGKLFRAGGDEFMAHVPSHEHAALFLRNLRSKLDAIPAVRGTHRLSTSAGIGHTPAHAEQALIQAKNAKKAMGYLPGQAKTHAASLVPGHEGVIPVE